MNHRIRWVRSAFAGLVLLLAPSLSSTTFGQVIATFEAETQQRQTGRVTADAAASKGKVVYAVGFKDGYGYMMYGPYITTLPANRNLRAYFTLAEIGTYNSNSVYIEVYDATANLTLATRLLRIDSHTGYQRHDLKFKVIQGHRIEFRTLFLSTPKTEVKLDKVEVELD